MQKAKLPKQDDIDLDTINPEAVEYARHRAQVIFSHSRSVAIADGSLKDASEMAKEVGYPFPVALTQAAWEKVVTVPPFSLSDTEEDRLWTLLAVLAWASRGFVEGDDIDFTVDVSSRCDGSEEVPLRAVCGEGDDGEPVVTVMLSHEE